MVNTKYVAIGIVDGEFDKSRSEKSVEDAINEYEATFGISPTMVLTLNELRRSMRRMR